MLPDLGSPDTILHGAPPESYAPCPLRTRGRLVVPPQFATALVTAALCARSRGQAVRDYSPRWAFFPALRRVFHRGWRSPSQLAAALWTPNVLLLFSVNALGGL